ncbi:MAG TPA: MFS transporter [Bacillota bacterium]|nr:MFS transporter [Bacillota bacterium]
MRQILAASRHVRILWAGQAVSQVGDKLTYVALPILALRTAGGSLGVYTLVLAVTVLPNVLFGWAAGALVDWADRRRLMAAVEIGRCICVAAMALQPGLPALLGLVFANSAFALVFRPALKAVVPALVPRADITRTQAMMESTARFLDVFGFLAAGAIALATGVSGALRLDAVTFVVSAVTLLRLPLALPRTQAGERFSNQVRAGFTYNRRNALARDSLIFLAALTLGAGAYNALIVPAMRVLLHQPLAFYGYWMAVQSVGAALGSYMVAFGTGRLSRRTRMLGSILVLGAIAALVGGNTSTAAAFALAFFFGIFNMGYDVTIVTWLQETVPPAMLGRVFALRQMGGGLFVILGTLAAGAWGAALGVGPMITLTGLYFMVVAVAGGAMPGLWASAPGAPHAATG